METLEKKVFNPEMLTLARKARGLTQGQLADQLCMKQAHISKIEAGMLNPPDGMLANVTRILGYQEGFFLQDDKLFGIESATIFHRMRQAVSAKLLDKVEAQVNIYRMQINRLLRAVDMDSKIHSYDIDEFGSVEHIANSVRGLWLLPSGPVKNLVKVIEDAGGIVIPYNFGTKQIDGLSQWIPPLPPLFFINSILSADRFRYSLAHELGHILLHRIPKPDMEKEANAFASEFLMPTKDISASLYSITLGKLADLKMYWRVSMAALVYKADHIGAISPDYTRKLRIQLAPYRTVEPVDIAGEEPSMLLEIINVYLKELGYTVSELCQMLSIHQSEFETLYGFKQRHLTLAN